MTRGYIIGKIADDLANLKYQIATRNSLGLFDLTKFGENFFRDLLNIVYGYYLVDLNRERSNHPGLDLGDEKTSIAFQVTSQKTSAKITATLEVINDELKKKYHNRKILVVGDKQRSYDAVDKTLIAAASFDLEEDIIDLDDILRDIVVLKTEKLDEIFQLFRREFRQLLIEFEPVDSEGNFESSYTNKLEQRPSSPPNNAAKFTDGDVKLTKSLIDSYQKLANVPRITRGLIAIIADRGNPLSLNHRHKQYGILPQKLKNLLRINDDQLQSEIQILQDANLVYYGESEIDNQRVHYVAIVPSVINELIEWCQGEDISFNALIATMDFSVLDKD